jgi:hypothetical protein
MLSQRDRSTALFWVVFWIAAAFVALIVGAVHYGVMSSNQAHSEVPGMILEVCIFAFVVAVANEFGWITVWRGNPRGYRVLAVINGFVALSTVVTLNHILFLMFLPFPIFFERKYRSVRLATP